MDQKEMYQQIIEMMLKRTVNKSIIVNCSVAR